MERIFSHLPLETNVPKVIPGREGLPAIGRLPLITFCWQKNLAKKNRLCFNKDGFSKYRTNYFLIIILLVICASPLFSFTI
jgi:hypothetical protein